MEEARKRIRQLEKEKDNVKHMHALGHITIAEAKKRLLCIESAIAQAMEKLPEYERQLLVIRKELGESI